MLHSSTLFVPSHVRSLEDVLPEGASITQDPEHDRVDLDQIQNTSRPKQSIHHAGPLCEIGQPPKGPDAGVDDVEGSPGERLASVVDVRADELGSNVTVDGELRCDLDCS